MSEAKSKGCKLSELQDKVLFSFETENAERILNGLELSGIKYCATYTDSEISLAVNGSDKGNLEEIIKRSEQSGAEDFLNREREHNGSFEQYKTLLPEIADIMNTSVSSLENMPFDKQMMLTHIYVNNYYADLTTIRTALSDVNHLNYATELDVQNHEVERSEMKNTAENMREKEREEQQETAAIVEGQAVHRQQREQAAREQMRTALFSVQSLHHQAQIIRRQRRQKSVDTAKAEEYDELSRKNNGG